MPDSDKTQSFHHLSIAAMIKALHNLQSVLNKAEDHAKQNNIDFATLLQASLYPDMYNLLQQLQYSCYVPADFAQHFSGDPVPRVGYDEATLADCRASIATTIAYLEGIPPQRLAERAMRVIPTFIDSSMGMTAMDYAAMLTLPDFYFHATAAYAILRHKGVPLGKGDFLGHLPMVPMAEAKS